MSSSLPDRQALLFGSCPKNIGNLRQLTWYSRQVPLHIERLALVYHYILYFLLDLTLSRRTVILCLQ